MILVQHRNVTGLILALILMSAVPQVHAQALGGAGAAAAVAAQRSSVLDALTRPLPSPAALPPSPAPNPVSNVQPTTGSEDRSAMTVKFQVRRITFVGVTLIPVEQLAELARPYVGRQQTLAELNQLTGAVEALYQKKGYIAVRVLIPAQRIVAGALAIAVYEGKYGATRVSGNKRYSAAFIDRFFRMARHTGFVEQPSLLRSLLILGQMPGLTVRSFLKPGEQPGTTDVDLQVTETSAFKFGYDYNNFGIRLVGRNRVGAFVSHSGNFVEGDELYVRVTEPFPTDSDPIYQGAYTLPVGDKGVKLSLQYLRSKTAVGGVLSPLDTRGDLELVALNVNHPLVLNLSDQSNFFYGLQFKTVESTVFGNIPISHDDLRELVFGYNHARSRNRARSIVQYTVTQGLGSLFGGQNNGDILASAFNAGNQFTKLNLDYNSLFQVNRHGYLAMRGSGQVTTVPLTVAEQFSIGGGDSVRGFVQTEFLGDQGFFVSAEYRHSIVEKKGLVLQLASFVDCGQAGLLHPFPGVRGQRTLTGGGAGVRANIGNWGTLRVEVGFPLNQRTSAEGDPSLLYVQHTAQF